MRIAVIGSGISGLAAAWLLGRDHAITLFESGTYLGGHTHTVDVTLEGVTHGVDTGFLVFNRTTYPNLVPMFEALGVPVVSSAMRTPIHLRVRRRQRPAPDHGNGNLPGRTPLW